MKKVFTLIFALVMLLSLSVGVFAADVTGGALSSYEGEVTGTYATPSSGTGGTVFSIDIAWGDLSFTYHPATVKDWDPSTHTYEGETHDAYWEGVGAITLTNHSNAMILATPSYTAGEGYDSVTMSFGNDALAEVAKPILASAEPVGEETAGSAQSLTIYAIPGGTLPNTANGGVIGAITLELTEYTTNFTQADANNLSNNGPVLDITYSQSGMVVSSADAADSGSQYVLQSAFTAARTAANSLSSSYDDQAKLNRDCAQAAARYYELVVFIKP